MAGSEQSSWGKSFATGPDILRYALCGFANFCSLGIMIGGMGAMSPEKRPTIIRLGMKSILAGTIATCMTGAVVGLIY